MSLPAHSDPGVTVPKWFDASLLHTQLQTQPEVPALRGQCLPVFIIAPNWLEAQGLILPRIFEVGLP